jgi:hypothetical protein
MYYSQAAVSWWTWPLHVTMVIIGGYLIGNLALAVIFLHFTKHYSAAKTGPLSRGESATGLTCAGVLQPLTVIPCHSWIRQLCPEPQGRGRE